MFTMQKDPMIFHISDDPLLEEYAIARQVRYFNGPRSRC
jgi:hypothetical protein